MNIFYNDHQKILNALIHHNVSFILIGGYSVIYYGYRRTTGDLDLWIKPSNENKLLLINALEEFGFEEGDLASLREIDFTKHLCFSIGEEPLKVDFITRINQVDYDEADKQKNVADIDGLKIPIICKSDLILSKFNTGRDKDKADVQELQNRTELDDKISNNKPSTD